MRVLASCTVSLADGVARFGRSGETPRTLSFADLGELKQIMSEDETLPAGDLTDFRRAADNVRLAQLGSLLCASTLGSAWSPADTAIIGINGDGCAHNNRLFWDDFTAHGHESGKASLFVPTLPSIPVCEAAITLGVRGPVRYLKTASEAQTEELLSEMFASDNSLQQIMTVETNACGAVVNLLARE